MQNFIASGAHPC